MPKFIPIKRMPAHVDFNVNLQACLHVSKELINPVRFIQSRVYLGVRELLGRQSSEVLEYL